MPVAIPHPVATRPRKIEGVAQRRLLEGVASIPNWTSLVGALEGLLRFLGAEIPSSAYLMGVCGPAFDTWVTHHEGEWFGAYRPPPLEDATLHRYELLGRRFRRFSFTAREDQKGRERTLKATKGSIDRGVPVAAFGLYIAEYGVVRGYDDGPGVLYVSSLTSDQMGEALPYEMWPPPGLPGPVDVLVPGERLPVEPVVAVRSALTFAVERASASLAALEGWAAALQSGEPVSARGHAHAVQVTLAARRDAAAFLREAAAAGWAPDPSAAEEAAQSYRDEALELSRLGSLFPYPGGGDLASPVARGEAARYLRRAREAEECAVGVLRMSPRF